MEWVRPVGAGQRSPTHLTVVLNQMSARFTTNVNLDVNLLSYS